MIMNIVSILADEDQPNLCKHPVNAMAYMLVFGMSELMGQDKVYIYGCA